MAATTPTVRRVDILPYISPWSLSATAEPDALPADRYTTLLLCIVTDLQYLLTLPLGQLQPHLPALLTFLSSYASQSVHQLIESVIYRDDTHRSKRCDQLISHSRHQQLELRNVVHQLLQHVTQIPPAELQLDSATLLNIAVIFVLDHTTALTVTRVLQHKDQTTDILNYVRKLATAASPSTDHHGDMCSHLYNAMSLSALSKLDTLHTAQYIVKHTDLLADVVTSYEQVVPSAAHERSFGTQMLQLYASHMLSAVQQLITHLLQQMHVGVTASGTSSVQLRPASHASTTLDLSHAVDQFIAFVTALAAPAAIQKQYKATARPGSFIAQVSRLTQLPSVLQQLAGSDFDGTKLRDEALDATQLAYVQTAVEEQLRNNAYYRTSPQVSVSKPKSKRQTSSQPLNQQATDAAVLELTELFTNMNMEYARACLDHYKGDLALTVQQTLEGKLPVTLAGALDSKSTDKQHSRLSSALERQKAGRVMDESASDEDELDESMVKHSNESDEAFAAYLKRTGRVAKTDPNAPQHQAKQSVLNQFQDRTEVDLLKAKLAAQFANMEEDEFNDGYDDFLDMPSIDTANFERNDVAGTKQSTKQLTTTQSSERRQQQGRGNTSSAAASSASDSDDNTQDVRAQWRQQSQQKDAERRATKQHDLNHTAPSRRTEQQQKALEDEDYDSVAYPTKPKYVPAADTSDDSASVTENRGQPQSQRGASGVRGGMRGARGRGGFRPATSHTAPSSSTTTANTETPVAVTDGQPAARTEITDDRERAYRNTNKAQFKNHNRKRGADKKLARAGGLPG